MRHARFIACSVIFLALGGIVKPADPGGVAVKSNPQPVAQNLEVVATPFANSLGMKFVSIPGTRSLFCIWKVRKRDFATFVQATGYNADQGMFSLAADGWRRHGHTWKNPGFIQTDDDPVVGVSWDDAMAFCQWLTDKERQEGRLKLGQAYRLPRDTEWSSAVGLPPEMGSTPKERDGRIKDAYPWGNYFPPHNDDGNYAGRESKIGQESGNYRFIETLNDGYARTSPVGSFKANKFGLYDMGGNAMEWCEDLYDNGSKGHVLRGASWRGAVNLLSSRRGFATPELREAGVGFRVVLVGGLAP